MDLSVFRLNRALPVQHCKAPELGDDYHQDESVSFSKTSIDAPGQRSRMRERFITTDRDRLGRPRKRSLSADNTRPNDGVAAANSTAYAESPVSESLSPTTPAHRGDEAAPVFLYSSPPISPSTIRASYAGGGRGSALAPGHMYFDAAGKPLTADDRVGAHWAYYPDGNVSTAIPGEMSQPQQPPPWFVNAHAGFDTQQTPTDPRVGDDRQYYFVAPPSVPGGQTYYPAMYGASPAPGHGQMVYAGQPPSPRAIPYVQYAHPVGMGVFPHTFAPLQGTEVIFDTPVTVAPGVHYEAVPVTTSPFDPAASAAPSATEHGYMGASAPVPSTPTLSSAQQEYWVYTSGAPPPSSAHPARSSSGAQVSPRFQQRLHNNARRAHPSASTNAGTYENALHHVSQMSPDTPPPAQRDSQRASGSPIEHDVFDAHSAEGNARGGRGGGGGSGGNNKLDIERIAAGADTRTTVMIRNIPNKMTDSDLVAFIDAVCPRRIDFLYLRMDFSNSCNVGYAFVNFITVEDLLLFAKEKLGKKWCDSSACLQLEMTQECFLYRNMFSSEKVLEMSYADYQCVSRLLFPPFVAKTDLLRSDQEQGISSRKIQELLYHGRERGLEAQNILLRARPKPGTPRAIPPADASSTQAAELAQSRGPLPVCGRSPSTWLQAQPGHGRQRPPRRSHECVWGATEAGADSKQEIVALLALAHVETRDVDLNQLTDIFACFRVLSFALHVLYFAVSLNTLPPPSVFSIDQH
ncbi:hypothetical protein HGRIS_002663 [Hohenbuehelia grisea]|uniref:Mei2-like C-terminal RNA recognition motif domain-containing protein n=1 Tax=Hohenbuehelia grisea TaxID=104357 RepID=A0ABR3JMD5_9AGAR